MLKEHYTANDKGLVQVNGRVIGRIVDGIFYKPVKGSKHRLRQPPAWAVDAGVWDEIRPMVNRIVIEDRESGTRYYTSADTFDRFRGVLDRGFGRQYYLPLTRWQQQSADGYGQLSFSFA